MASSPTVPVLAAPIYPSMDFYPSSPIHSFPPPASPNHRPLRARCGITMKVNIPASTFSSAPQHCWSPKLNTQPHRSNLPRRRKVRRMVIHEELDTPVVAVEAEAEVEPEWKAERVVEVVHGYTPHPRDEEPSLQEIIPNVYIAFAEDYTAEPPMDKPDQPYTHIVRIHFANEAGKAERIYDNRIQYLHLAIPQPALPRARTGLGLTDAQLRAARDFLAEALPQSAAANSGQSGVRILVTTPFGRANEAMTVLVCYLSFASGKAVVDVLKYIDDDEEVCSVWRAEVSEDEQERAEKIARAWSWLNQIPQHPLPAQL